MNLEDAQAAIVGKTINNGEKTGHVLNVAPNRAASQELLMADDTNFVTIASAEKWNVKIRWADGEIETLTGVPITIIDRIKEEA